MNIIRDSSSIWGINNVMDTNFNEALQGGSAFIVLDSEEKILFINESAQTMLGLDQLIVVDKTFDDKKISKSTKGLDGLREECKSVIATNKSMTNERAIERRPNSKIRVSYEIAPLSRDNNECIGCAITMTSPGEQNTLKKNQT